MARMMQLDPAPKCVLADGPWYLIVTEAGRYGHGLRGTVQLWGEDDRLVTAACLDLVDPEERADFAIAVSAESGLDHKVIKTALFTLIAEIENVLRRHTQHSRGADDDDHVTPYKITPQGLVWLKPTQNGIIETPLSNFIAEIVTDMQIDDGAEKWRIFTIRITLNSQTPTLDVPAARFPAMAWPMERLGADEVIYPGQTLRDHTRAAVQMLSQAITKRFVYAHLGWRNIGDRWVYLHAGGAIGPDGSVAGIEVQTDPALAHYVLPEPPDGSARERAVKASLRFLDVAPRRITLAPFLAIWRAPLRGGDSGIHIAGPTGEGKTALAALMQQHFGTAMDARHLPASWTSSANALEAIAFGAKDALLVIDEFTPTDSSQAQLLHRTAERLFRAQANRTGRQRMRPDTTLRPVKPLCGFIVSTGEDVPKGQSLRARMVILDVEPNAVDFARLTTCQTDAAGGLYAQAMASFLQWLAPRYDRIRRRFPKVLERFRRKALQSGMHRRTPENIASLALGWGYFLHFARDIGVLNAQESLQHWRDGWQTLGEVAQIQAHYLTAAEPTRRFLELLREAVASGKAYLAAADGMAPFPPGAYGWRKPHADAESYHPLGTKIGWIDGNFVYLLADASYAVAQTLGRDVGDALVVSPQTLRKRLKEKGILASVDQARQTLTVRRVLEGKSQNVLHIFIESLMDHQPDKPDIEGFDTPSDSNMSGLQAQNVGPMSGLKTESDNDNTQDNNGLQPNVGFVGSENIERPYKNEKRNPVVGSPPKPDSKTRQRNENPDILQPNDPCPACQKSNALMALPKGILSCRWCQSEV